MFSIVQYPQFHIPLPQDYASITALHGQTSVYLCFPSERGLGCSFSAYGLCQCPCLASTRVPMCQLTPGLASSGIKIPPCFLAKSQQALVITASPTHLSIQTWPAGQHPSANLLSTFIFSHQSTSVPVPPEPFSWQDRIMQRNTFQIIAEQITVKSQVYLLREKNS